VSCPHGIWHAEDCDDCKRDDKLAECECAYESLFKENAELRVENARLTALLAPPTILTAEEVTEPGLYAWRKGKDKLLWWVLVEFADIYNPGKGDVESVLCRRSFQNGQKVRVAGCASPGQFVGPITFPEV
jgi:hypothetical protein